MPEGRGKVPEAEKRLDELIQSVTKAMQDISINFGDWNEAFSDSDDPAFELDEKLRKVYEDPE
jgi:hypothetical protein